MPDFKNKVRFEDVTVIAETEKAILCNFGDGVEHWIPQSQIDDDSECWKLGDEGILIVSEWIAEQKKLA